MRCTYLPVSLHRSNDLSQYWNLNQLSIAYALRLGLGPDLPWADEPSPGNLRLSMAWILTMLSLLIPAFSLLSRPAVLSIYLRPTIECSSTTHDYS